MDRRLIFYLLCFGWIDGILALHSFCMYTRIVISSFVGPFDSLLFLVYFGVDMGFLTKVPKSV